MKHCNLKYDLQRIQGDFGLIIQNFRAIFACYISYLLTLGTLHTLFTLRHRIKEQPLWPYQLLLQNLAQKFSLEFSLAKLKVIALLKKENNPLRLLVGAFLFLGLHIKHCNSKYDLQRIQGDCGLIIQNFRVIFACYISYLLTLGTLHTPFTLRHRIMEQPLWQYQLRMRACSGATIYLKESWAVINRIALHSLYSSLTIIIWQSRQKRVYL